ncbi:hypothetical protein ATCVTN60342_201R [Acanthocystis turfacea Chlorella virus TN603.4.2]|nr:hypothetical protein ATCVTN60342_201R [Acanthocystis turfacea Chlorella virus TN603.4.2]
MSSTDADIHFQRVITASPAELDEAFPRNLLLTEQVSKTLEFRSYDLTTHLIRGYVNPSKTREPVRWNVVQICE